MKTKQRTANEATVIGLEFKLGFAPVSFFRSPFSSGGGGGGEGYSIEFYAGRHRPEVQLRTPFLYHF